ncbi:biotin/lipoyl-containing protein [Bradyrhizobium sp. AUGA SZCCT0160]|uniref:biotin/lipoyl-containing protein n=1 Tax=Bradyrhizobium sp. AUGA SZCCT0160 TaxID=2807662 RepID=UPI001BA818BE|nr:biotin/lipoyl-containing protein [Bradyrhizobium sp. AUGA SZCCT0160]MBR1187341.1 hypothetical protein [Bradyrhizobium sp. AUGA SZCCT0160]
MNQRSPSASTVEFFNTIGAKQPFTVWKIAVQAGDALEADDTIMILKSMKMEIPVVRPKRAEWSRFSSPRVHLREGQEIAVFAASVCVLSVFDGSLF